MGVPMKADRRQLRTFVFFPCALRREVRLRLDLVLLPWLWLPDQRQRDRNLRCLKRHGFPIEFPSKFQQSLSVRPDERLGEASRTSGLLPLFSCKR